jgi:hypothetical protein
MGDQLRSWAGGPSRQCLGQCHRLIIPNPPLGFNPVPSFRATVSCLTPDGPVNVTTDPAPPTARSGNAMIVGKVALPHPCKDPIVFVVNGSPLTPNGHNFAWFAMSNAEDGA